MSMFTPDPRFMTQPIRRPDETEEKFNKRLQEYLDKLHAGKPSGVTITLTFRMPKDNKALKDYLDENPNAEMTYHGPESGLKESLRFMKSIGRLDNVARAEICDDKDANKINQVYTNDKDTDSKAYPNAEIKDLNKLKKDIIPGLRPPGM